MNQRFYDQEPLLQEAIRFTDQLPKEVQFVAVQGISEMAIRYFQADIRLGNLKSLGTEVILPLYKSKSKRRQYDAIPAFHTAINYLRVLNPEERHHIADRMVSFHRLVADYLEKCKFTALIPDHTRLTHISETFLPMEKDRAEEYLTSVRQELLAIKGAPPNSTERKHYIFGGTSIHLGEF